MSDGVFLDTESMDWESGLVAIGRMSEQFRRNLGGTEEELALAFIKYHQKVLHVDPDSTRRLDLVRLDPGYRDLSFGYHDSVEECLCLEGEIHVEGEGQILKGEYFWRPPGWVHGAFTRTGSLALMSFEGLSEGDLSERVSRNIRPVVEAGTNAKWPTIAHEQVVGRRGWVRRLDTALLPWIPGTVFARSEGRFEGFDLEHISFKVLSKNLWTGAQSLLVKVHPGYAQLGTGCHTEGQEIFVIAGSMNTWQKALNEGAYWYRPAGSIEPALSSETGAILFWKANGWLDFNLCQTAD